MCHHYISDKVAVDFNMLRSLMKNMIIDNIRSRLIIKIHYYWPVVEDAHLERRD